MKLSSSQSISSLLLGIQIATTVQNLVLAAETQNGQQSIQSRLLEKCCEVGKEQAMASPKFNCKMGAREALITRPSSGGRNLALLSSSSAAAAESLLTYEPTFADQCEMILESCCMGHHRTRNCNSGKQFAKSGAACMDVELSKEATVATESFNDCCMSCSLGILAARTPGQNETTTTTTNANAIMLNSSNRNQQLNQRCKLLSPLASSLSGQLYEQTYTECCQENLPRVSNALTEPGAAIDCAQSNPCSQRCIGASTGYEPSAISPGRRRMDNQQGTHRGSSDRCDCFAGYKLASDGVSCLDIDECKLQQHTCNPQSEVCDNTRGGFRCLARRSMAMTALGPASGGGGADDDEPETQAESFVPMRLCPLGKRWNNRDQQCQPLDGQQRSFQQQSSSSSSYARSSAYQRSTEG